MTSLAWCTTCYSNADAFSTAGFFHMALALGRLGIDAEPFVRTDMECGDACNAIMEDVAAREAERGSRFTHVLWMDDDVIVKPDDLGRWLDMVDAEHRAVYSLAFFRTDPYRPSIWLFQDDAREQAGKRIAFHLYYPKNELIPIACAGLCAALFDRTVFDEIPKPYFRWVEGGYMVKACTPDAFLCGQLNTAGIQLWCHTGLETKHVGMPLLVDEATAIGCRERWGDGQ
ncbi:MAG TPA: hypothetical protein VM243_02215 [Phycisphaerae bacterium]|nr:hypothetical protein [Phycisphaerae bacterium]